MTAPLFASLRDFEKPSAAEPEEPVISLAAALEQSALAREEGFAAGYQCGKEDGQAQAEDTIGNQNLARLRKIADEVESLKASEHKLLEALEVHATRLIFSIAKRLTDTLSDQHADRIAQSVVRRLVTHVGDESRLVIKTAPGALKDVEALFAPIDQTAGAPAFRIVSDPALTGQEIHVTWRDGGLTYDLSPDAGAINTIVDEALERLNADTTQTGGRP